MKGSDKRERKGGGIRVGRRTQGKKGKDGYGEGREKIHGEGEVRDGKRGEIRRKQG